MRRIFSRTIAVPAVLAVCAAGLIAVPAASAKTVSVKIHFQDGTIDGINLTSKGSGTFGKCSMKGKLVIPKTQQVWTCKGGTLKVEGLGTSGASDDAKGTWKVTGGTGKFKKAKGGGTFSGKQSTAVFDYVGKVTY